MLLQTGAQTNQNRCPFETPSIFIKHIPSTFMQTASTTETVYGLELQCKIKIGRGMSALLWRMFVQNLFIQSLKNTLDWQVCCMCSFITLLRRSSSNNILTKTNCAIRFYRWTAGSWIAFSAWRHFKQTTYPPWHSATSSLLETVPLRVVQLSETILRYSLRHCII